MEQLSIRASIDSCKGILLAWVSDCNKLERMLKEGRRSADRGRGYDRVMAVTILMFMPLILIAVSAACVWAIFITVAAKVVVEVMPLIVIVILFIGALALVGEILW